MTKNYCALPALGLGLLLLSPLLSPRFARGDEKVIQRDDTPPNYGRFRVAPDGSRIYMTGQNGKYLVFDANGKLLNQFGVSNAGQPKDLVPLPDGKFIGFTSYFSAHIALVRADGTEEKTIITKGSNPNQLRADGTGVTSPTGGAVDVVHQRIFALDTTIAPRDDRHLPDLDWSRIAIFDFDGKYVGDINRWDAYAADAKDKDDRRTWYDDVEVDPQRERVYVTARRFNEIWAFGYDGTPQGKAPGRNGLAVFPDGRVAVGAADGKGIQIYDADLKPLQKLDVPVDAQFGRDGRGDLETDAQGRLYASAYDPSVTFFRWSSDLKTRELFGPQYLRIAVTFPDNAVVAGKLLQIGATVSGSPAPENPDAWQVLARPADGSDLRWQTLPSTYQNGSLQVSPPANLRGFYEIAVRFGPGPIVRADLQNDPVLQKTFAFMPAGATRSLAVIPDQGRRVFQQGEPIALHVVRRVPTSPTVATTPDTAKVRLDLLQNTAVIKSQTVNVAQNYGGEIPGALTWRLAPGHYALRPSATGHESYALGFDIVPAQVDSPMQRIMYHEFGGDPLGALNGLPDSAEQMALLRNWTAAAANLGFTRETIRGLGDQQAWRRDSAPADVTNPAFAPAEWYGIGNNAWTTEAYLDLADKYGIVYDGQLITHCGAIQDSPQTLAASGLILQHNAQWLERFPSFYGFNYNDEMWIGGANEQKSDQDWFKNIKDTTFKGQPDGKARQFALNTMYAGLNAAVHQAAPDAKTTSTPMWQFPAVEGSYPPENYKGMSESYSHWISEGYTIPWYPAHSVEILKRPGKPMMGVFDNLYDSTQAGDLYMKNVMQVAARGVQGTGAQHTAPFADPRGADAYRTANLMATMYGPIFAEMPPANEASVLYSVTQDFTEQRNVAGTPQWERVLTMVGAGLMAGVPMNISFEEDIAAGQLLDGKKPRSPMLFLVGLQQKLPPKVQQKIAEYIAAGGKVFTDSESAAFPGATKLDIQTYETKPLFQAGYAADTSQPLFQPAFEKLALALKRAVGGQRRFPMDTDDPWISKNRFNGWGVQYVALATETSPYPWDAGSVWGAGDMYNKGKNAWLPKTTTLRLSASKGVIYDVFNHTILKPQTSGKTTTITADLTNFPGALYAMAPAPLGAPQLAAGVQDGTVFLKAQIVDDKGADMSARVPLRIRLFNSDTTAAQIYRGTGTKGDFQGSLALPATAKTWTLEVTELLGGKSSSVTVSGAALPAALLSPQPDADIERAAQLRDLLEDAKQNGLTLALANDKVLSEAQRKTLSDALQARGITLKTTDSLPATSTPGLYLTAGTVEGNQLGSLLDQARAHGLFSEPLSPNVPGAGCGFATAIFAPRGFSENVIALVGGDARGLDAAVQKFAGWLKKPDVVSEALKMLAPRYELSGKPTTVTLPRVSEMTGPKLSAISVASDNKHLVVTSSGYLKNLALVEDSGSAAKVVRAVRVGQSFDTTSSFVSDDGHVFGAAGRTIDRFGQGFYLVGADGAPHIFADFGDIGRQSNRFAASGDGNTIVAPGTYGVACWQREGGNWKQAWSLDYWKEFNQLDWPVSAEDERTPQFHAVIPHGADYALICFGETSSNGWITPEHSYKAWLAAINLSDGKERWHFDVPVPNTLLFPTLYTSPDGSKTLLQVQLGSWGKETFRLYSIDNDNGKVSGSWNSKIAPTTVALANNGGLIAVASTERLLEVRRPDSSLVWNVIWPRQPTSLEFAADGKSLYVCDDSGALTKLDANGKEVWHRALGSVSVLASARDTIYAAGWDGRLRAYSNDGQRRWALDLTSSLDSAHPMQTSLEAAKFTDANLHEVAHPPTTSSDVPAGANLLGNGQATLKVGGTGGWMSGGAVGVKAEALTNGKTDDVNAPWMTLNELFWNGQAGRQVWAEIDFTAPTDVHTLTVYENPKHPASFPTDSVVQVWNDTQKRWDTAQRGLFLKGAVNTYSLNLTGVTKLRYVPWSSYYRNFYTSEIEVR